MTVAQLIEKLREYPAETLVLVDNGEDYFHGYTAPHLREGDVKPYPPQLPGGRYAEYCDGGGAGSPALILFSAISQGTS